MFFKIVCRVMLHLCIVLSSAKLHVSLIKKLKKNGPIIEPRGTPLTISYQLPMEEPIFVLCLRFVR